MAGTRQLTGGQVERVHYGDGGGLYCMSWSTDLYGRMHSVLRTWPVQVRLEVGGAFGGSETLGGRKYMTRQLQPYAVPPRRFPWPFTWAAGNLFSSILYRRFHDYRPLLLVSTPGRENPPERSPDIRSDHKCLWRGPVHPLRVLGMEVGLRFSPQSSKKFQQQGKEHQSD
ncbi:hypothetical protein CIRG_03858 [Coccidioides immitis RMSCC 2394]|uniref:Uncharacterized protein n=1 Tax=Coccidioides immitis RMSCC 2394 TaxID=404692 RepID=A0A0J7B2Z1_COCIT|nr:hypothetical protein CIRG_03858 [Coccidioides immitis RMSCC 2394]